MTSVLVTSSLIYTTDQDDNDMRHSRSTNTNCLSHVQVVRCAAAAGATVFTALLFLPVQSAQQVETSQI
jgi:hypothetical protein